MFEKEIKTYLTAFNSSETEEDPGLAAGMGVTAGPEACFLAFLLFTALDRERKSDPLDIFSCYFVVKEMNKKEKSKVLKKHVFFYFSN